MATDWSDWTRPDVFGEYTPEQQYTALMQHALPKYYTPRYSQMASRQFNPTYGRYLLGGYGTGDNVTGAGAGTGFSDWFTGQPSMQDPEAVQAMALARYYGGGGPTGGYVGRAIQNTLSNLYGRYANTGALAGDTSPSGFVNYLGGLSGSRFGAVT